MVVPDAGFHVVAIFFTKITGFLCGLSRMVGPLLHMSLKMGLWTTKLPHPFLRFCGISLGFKNWWSINIHNTCLIHNLCGAAAVAFIGHIMVSAPLPQDLDALSDCHSNMKAVLYRPCLRQMLHLSCCMGAGSNAGLVKSLASELAKHGVPEGLSEKRAQQAIHAIGADPVQQALSSKTFGVPESCR